MVSSSGLFILIRVIEVFEVCAETVLSLPAQTQFNHQVPGLLPDSGMLKLVQVEVILFPQVTTDPLAPPETTAASVLVFSCRAVSNDRAPWHFNLF
jgi:hypothetical protein